jgi:hypothetical protein
MNGPECHQTVTLALIDVGTIGIVSVATILAAIQY